MRAELPLAAPAPFARPRHLSAAGRRALVEGAVRIGDVLTVAASGLAVAAWRFGSPALADPASPGPGTPDTTLAALVIGCLLAANVLPRFCDYHGARLFALSWQVPRLLAGWALTMAALIALLFAFKVAGDVSRLWVGWWFVAGAFALLATRVALRLALARGDAARSLAREVAVVGLGEHLAATVARLAVADPAFRVTLALDLDGSLQGRWPRGVVALNGFADLEQRARTGGVDKIVLALPGRGGDLLERSLRNLRHLGIDVSWVPELPAGRVPVLGVARIGDVPMVRLIERPLDGWRWVAKGIEDRLLAAGLLLFLAPLLAIIAAAVKLDTPGPVFYRQRRHGFSRQPIAMLKFRTMHSHMCDPIDARSVRQATRHDPRVTRVGRTLRRTSLDELPQLWNVLVGEMSIVGPRPHAVAHDEHYADLIDDYLGRHRVKPGITGWAQIHGYRGETRNVEDMRRRIELDLDYIDRWSLWLDLHILVRTVAVGFVHRNAH